MSEVLEKMLSDSPFPWWKWDIEKNLLEFNSLKATILGYDAEDFKGKGYQNFTNLLHKEDYRRTMDAMQRVLDNEADLFQIDYRILSAKGDYQWYMDRGIVTERKDGRPSKMRGIVIDLGSEDNPRRGADILGDMIISDREAPYFILCSNCWKLKESNSRWIPVSPGLISSLKGVPSHSICPDCLRLLYPEHAREIIEKLGL